jgi:hypothetical protein
MLLNRSHESDANQIIFASLFCRSSHEQTKKRKQHHLSVTIHPISCIQHVPFVSAIKVEVKLLYRNTMKYSPLDIGTDSLNSGGSTSKGTSFQSLRRRRRLVYGVGTVLGLFVLHAMFSGR